ncbi:MAG: hypothetical protein ACYSX0_22400, partial [Planctomycetota bacterium]
MRANGYDVTAGPAGNEVRFRGAFIGTYRRRDALAYRVPGRGMWAADGRAFETARAACDHLRDVHLGAATERGHALNVDADLGRGSYPVDAPADIPRRTPRPAHVPAGVPGVVRVIPAVVVLAAALAGGTVAATGRPHTATRAARRMARRARRDDHRNTAAGPDPVDTWRTQDEVTLAAFIVDHLTTAGPCRVPAIRAALWASPHADRWADVRDIGGRIRST